jgi:hypothetical protein
MILKKAPGKLRSLCLKIINDDGLRLPAAFVVAGVAAAFEVHAAVVAGEPAVAAAPSAAVELSAAVAENSAVVAFAAVVVEGLAAVAGVAADWPVAAVGLLFVAAVPGYAAVVCQSRYY